MNNSFGRWLTVYFTNHLAKIHTFLKARLTSWNITDRLALTCEVIKQPLWVVVSEWTSAWNIVIVARDVFALFTKFK